MPFAALDALREQVPVSRSQADAVASVLAARIADTEGRARACAQAVTRRESQLATQPVADRLGSEQPEQPRARRSPGRT